MQSRIWNKPSGARGLIVVKIAGMVFYREKQKQVGRKRGNRHRWQKRDTDEWETLASRAEINLPRCQKCRNMVHPEDMRGEVCRECV